MNRRAAILVGLLVAVAWGVVGCIVLSGQRITMFHDEGQDRLSFLVQYDGIFESEEEVPDDSVEKMEQFVAGGEVMLLDWFGHLKWDEMRKQGAEAETLPMLRNFVDGFLDGLSVKIIGRYRDPDGKVGVAQLVVIDRISGVIRAANAAISEAYLQPMDVDPDWVRTHRRVVEAARRDHQWIRLAGHAIVVSFPIHDGEWASHRFDSLLEAFVDWEDSVSRADEKVEDIAPDAWLRLLASGPLSIDQTRRDVTFRIGDPTQPSTFRIRLRDGYRPNLEKHVGALVEADLDRDLISQLLGIGAGLAEGAAVLPPWAPPEEPVRAVLASLEGADSRERGAALAWLADFGVAWDQGEGFPAAPKNSADEEEWLEAWRAWYRDVSSR